MKSTTTSLIFLLSFGIMAQSTYESPYVYEGKTFQIQIPKGLEVQENEMEFIEVSFFLADTLQKADIYNLSNFKIELLMLVHANSEGKSLEEEMTLFEKAATKEIGEKAHFISKAKIEKLGELEFLTAGISGEVNGSQVDHVFIAMTHFGEYTISFNYVAPEKKSQIKSMRKFKKLLKSLKVIPTEKKNQIRTMDYLEGDFDELLDELDEMLIEIETLDTSEIEVVEYISETDFKNDLYETRFTYDATISNSDDLDWVKSTNGSGHLLASFDYRENDGFVQLFSGGPAVNYSSDSSLTVALSEVFEMNSVPLIHFHQLFKTELGTLVEYRFIYDHEIGNYLALYTVTVDQELIFIVAGNDGEIAPDYNKAYELFIKTINFDGLRLH